jgi:hypothetical protein
MTFTAQLDPLLNLALALYNTRGGYAVLLGSGVSRGAGIATGWEIVEDLIRMVASLEGGDAPGKAAANAESWYKERFGEPPSYSKVLERLAATPSERRELLRPYFEPTAEERERGLKVPTKAHRALARLVRDGIVRVILTTNFDPLQETAIRDEGISPAVLSTPDAILGMMPFHLSPATIVKLNGDYLDTRAKNTVGELAKYNPAVDALLDRVLDEYGLVVCGWSATWDDALRRAVLRAKNRRFSTFWALRGEPTVEARELIDHRQAQVIAIESADQFFDTVAEKVATLESFRQPHPLSTAVAVATMKRYLPSSENRIRLNDLVEDEIVRLMETVRPLIKVSVEPQPALVFDVMQKIEAATETVTTLLATGAYWGEEHHRELWVRALTRLGSLAGPETWRGVTFYDPWVQLLRYPAQLAFYSAGLSALARGKAGDEVAADLILLPQLRLGLNGEVYSPAMKLNVYEAVDDRIARQAIPKSERKYTAMSDHLFEVIRPFVRAIIPEDAEYEDLFDRFEYLIALAYADTRMRSTHFGFWAPVGRLAWRWERIFPPQKSQADKIADEIQREGLNWLFLRRGLFDGSLEPLAKAQAGIKEVISRRGQ